MEKIGLKKIYGLMILLVAVVFLLRTPIETSINSIQKTLPKIAEIEFEDSDGRVILMDKSAKRIISLETSHTQNLFSMGAGYLIVGTGYQEVYPLEIKELDKFNIEKDAEEIISKNPELVLITPDIRRLYKDQIDMLLRSGINVVSLYPENIEDIDDYLIKLGITVGLEKKAKVLSDEIIGSINKEKEIFKTSKKISFESSDMEKLFFDVNSIEGSMIAYAGGIYSEEIENTDIYFSQTGFRDLGGSLMAIYERKDSENIEAVKKGHVYEINKSISSPTMMMAKGISDMKRIINSQEYRNLDYLKDNGSLTKKVLSEMIVVYSGVQIFYPDYSYYSEERRRYYGDFEDVELDNEYFEYIETAVGRGIMDYEINSKGVNFNPEYAVSREEFAKAIWMIRSDYDKIRDVEIEDLGECENPRIVKRLVEAGVFETKDDLFKPNAEISCEQAVEIFERLGE